MAASFVNVNLALTYTTDLTSISIQSMLDGIFPNVLEVALVLFGYWLLTRKKVKAVTFILILLVIATVGVAFGIL